MYHYKARIYSPTLGRFLQVDPVGYDDQVNLYAYAGNDPVNYRDPNGTCKNRDEAGECVVRNNAGVAGTVAAANLQAQVRQVDHAIQGLDPEARLRVNIGNGQFREMTGEQIQNRWADTTWTIVPETAHIANGHGAEMDSSGNWRGKASYIESYRTSARESNPARDENEATRSVVLHDFGHITRIGRAMHDL